MPATNGREAVLVLRKVRRLSMPYIMDDHRHCVAGMNPETRGRQTTGRPRIFDQRVSCREIARRWQAGQMQGRFVEDLTRCVTLNPTPPDSELFRRRETGI